MSAQLDIEDIYEDDAGQDVCLPWDLEEMDCPNCGGGGCPWCQDSGRITHITDHASPWNTWMIPLDAIVLREDLQVRPLNEPTVARYRMAYARGERMPPVRLHQLDGVLVLVGGHHRVRAARRAGLPWVNALLEDSPDFATSYITALDDNRGNALPMSNADKRRAVDTMLEREDFSGLSLREMASIAGVSHTYVRNRRLALSPAPPAPEPEDGSGHQELIAGLEKDLGLGGKGEPSWVQALPELVNTLCPALPTTRTPCKGALRLHNLTNAPVPTYRCTACGHEHAMVDREEWEWWSARGGQLARNPGDFEERENEHQTSLSTGSSDDFEEAWPPRAIQHLCSSITCGREQHMRWQRTNEDQHGPVHLYRCERCTRWASIRDQNLRNDLRSGRITLWEEPPMGSRPRDQGEGAGGNVSDEDTKNECYTPAQIIQAARAVMGRIDLDPASCAAANRTVQAAEIFSAEDNGLELLWGEVIGHPRTVWCNPPYNGRADGPTYQGKGNLEAWVDKALEELGAGRIDQLMMLVNANIGTAWFRRLHRGQVCLLAGRIAFEGPGGGSAPRHYNAVAYFGPHELRFAEHFAHLGVVIPPQPQRLLDMIGTEPPAPSPTPEILQEDLSDTTNPTTDHTPAHAAQREPIQGGLL